jgi:hypothetical protein
MSLRKSYLPYLWNKLTDAGFEFVRHREDDKLALYRKRK